MEGEVDMGKPIRVYSVLGILIIVVATIVVAKCVADEIEAQNAPVIQTPPK